MKIQNIFNSALNHYYQARHSWPVISGLAARAANAIKQLYQANFFATEVPNFTMCLIAKDFLELAQILSHLGFVLKVVNK
jgi:hypothetical protein